MPPRLCTVTLIDSRGIKHSVEVTAESLYEAGVLAVAAFRQAGWVEEVPGPGARLEIEIREPVVKHTVTVGQLQAAGEWGGEGACGVEVPENNGGEGVTAGGEGLQRVGFVRRQRKRPKVDQRERHLGMDEHRQDGRWHVRPGCGRFDAEVVPGSDSNALLLQLPAPQHAVKLGRGASALLQGEDIRMKRRESFGPLRDLAAKTVPCDEAHRITVAAHSAPQRLLRFPHAGHRKISSFGNPSSMIVTDLQRADQTGLM